MSNLCQIFALQSMYDQWSLQNVLGRHNSGRDVPDSVVNEWGANATAWQRHAGKGA